ncbi:hypothetical protein [Shewanella waksmanii]|uniref:hypothetical protein n=1 Tax=Shewanella waksmanii TaxID=213783 RepID=UPI003734C44E
MFSLLNGFGCHLPDELELGFRLQRGLCRCYFGTLCAIHGRLTKTSDVKGFTNAAVTWMSKSGHVFDTLSRIYTGLFVSSIELYFSLLSYLEQSGLSIALWMVAGFRLLSGLVVICAMDGCRFSPAGGVCADAISGRYAPSIAA